MTKRNIIPILLLLVFALGACKEEAGGAPEPSRPTSAAEIPTLTPTPTPTPDPIGDKIAAMTTEELVGQLLVAGIEGEEPGEDARQVIEELAVGGIILFGRNVEAPGQLVELTNGLKEWNREAGNIPLFLCVDEEGGMVSRMPPEVADLPNAFDYMTAGGDPYALGQCLGAECAAFGCNVDLAPVLDVWSNPNNTVIGRRSFGTEAQTAADSAPRTAQGIADRGVIPVGKHFPGHGDTETDSHVGLPVVNKSLSQLEELELIPFRRAVSQDLPAVMAAHILMTRIDPLLPASLSPKVVDGLLREELGFQGVVFTDDLTMGAITENWDMPEAAVLAVQAGCDMALVCHGLDNVKAAYYGLLFAVEDGTLSRERLEESVRRILTLKEAYAVDDSPVEVPDVEELNRMIQSVIPK